MALQFLLDSFTASCQRFQISLKFVDLFKILLLQVEQQLVFFAAKNVIGMSLATTGKPKGHPARHIVHAPIRQDRERTDAPDIVAVHVTLQRIGWSLGIVMRAV